MAEVGKAMARALKPPSHVGHEATVQIRALAAGGAGVGDLPDGRAVFVHRTAPGDRALIRITRSRSRWAAGRLQGLEHEGPHRQAALCPRYDRCGGCTLQHVPYAEQLLWKGRFVADALTRMGGTPVSPPEVVASPRSLHYRNRMTFAVKRLRGGAVVAGLHELGRGARVIDVDGACVLPEERLCAAWDGLRARWGPGAGRLPAGGLLRVTLRATASGVALLVSGGRGDGDLARLLGDVPELVAIWRQDRGRSTPRLVAGAGPSSEPWLGDNVAAGPHAFLQVNREAAELLHEHTLRAVGKGRVGVDAYCGVGTCGRAMGRAGWGVVGIESASEACAAAAKDAPDGFLVEEGRVEVVLPQVLSARATDAVVVNPPRTGLHPDVPAQLADGAPDRIVYVSCDPATLARDAKRLAGAYRLTELAAFDLFPQTHHVETVATFVRQAT